MSLQKLIGTESRAPDKQTLPNTQAQYLARRKVYGSVNGHSAGHRLHDVEATCLSPTEILPSACAAENVVNWNQGRQYHSPDRSTSYGLLIFLNHFKTELTFLG